MGTSASVWKDLRAGMSMFVPVYADHEQCPVLHGKGEEEIIMLLS